jgi:hypothetical protein
MIPRTTLVTCPNDSCVKLGSIYAIWLQHAIQMVSYSWPECYGLRKYLSTLCLQTLGAVSLKFIHQGLSNLYIDSKNSKRSPPQWLTMIMKCAKMAMAGLVRKLHNTMSAPSRAVPSRQATMLPRQTPSPVLPVEQGARLQGRLLEPQHRTVSSATVEDIRQPQVPQYDAYVWGDPNATLQQLAPCTVLQLLETSFSTLHASKSILCNAT